MYFSVNGSIGTVRYVVFLEGNTSKMPDVVLVHFEDYLGPSCLKDEEKVVAITPRTASWIHKKKQMSRKQFPLQPAYGLSIHKGQGMTIPKLILNVGSREFSGGLTYTGVTRVKRLDDLAFRPFPNYCRYEI